MAEPLEQPPEIAPSSDSNHHHVMGDNEKEVHTRLLAENAVEDNDDDIIISVPVPQLGPSIMVPSATPTLNSYSNCGGQPNALGSKTCLSKKVSSSSLRGSWKLKYQDFLPGKPCSINHWNSDEQFPYVFFVDIFGYLWEFLILD